MTTEDRSKPERRSRVPWSFSGVNGAPLVKGYDLLVTLGLISGYLATFVLPSRFDPWLARNLSRLFMTLRRGNVAKSEAVLRRGLGARADGIDVAEAVQGFYAGKFEYAVGRVRGMHPRAWQPQIEVEGREWVDAALAEGRGAILWRMDMGDTLQLQRAAWQSGWPLVQLSSANHGLKGSRLGSRIGAPLYARPENAYLVDRVKIPVDWSYSYLPRLIRALNANQVVAILGEIVARQNVIVPLLEGDRPLPTGAPALAHRTGAVLIPAMTVREGPWRYRVRLGPPVEVDRSLPRREATEQAVREFGRFLEEAIATHPSDWNGWWRLRIDGRAAWREAADSNAAPADEG